MSTDEIDTPAQLKRDFEFYMKGEEAKPQYTAADLRCCRGLEFNFRKSSRRRSTSQDDSELYGF
jgi:hypothetical protein